jgi:hypothetical protein
MKFTPASHPNATQWFNDGWAKSVSEDAFVAAMRDVPFWGDVPERDGELRKAWRIMNGLPAEPPAAAEPSAAELPVKNNKRK